MIPLDIPGFGLLRLEHLVLDFNGTLALDGALLPGVAGALRSLAGSLDLHVVTADTHGGCARALAGLPVRLTVLPPGAEHEAKREAVRALGAEACVAVGNGRNDALMLAEAALGVAVVQGECASAEAVRAADLIAPDILAALGLLLRPARILAGLRR
ncbi:HAD family hydrolase [Paucidesulfovibrio longus]|uniref:HAD family hydrolase n=1 Tax=Paucidesulfovibrio longus TaxID=889 RepID=UPI0003B582E8|nr:HAD family hydrolase [Paucidesulfovibrio longus]